MCFSFYSIFLYGFKCFEQAKLIICGMKVMHTLKKGQLQQKVKSVQSEIEFIHKLFQYYHL
ncbi:transposase [Peribacillus asahii]|uniref:Transposase n=1 Tax=Peribacillus asahii TaxID=228899 RepID=A0A3T0KQ88_9BACI|nr:transposase [Peribacillus asahii]